MTKAPLLQIDGLTVTFSTGGVFTPRSHRIRAVNGISFDINQGETFGLVGESGSGKSTTGKAILRVVDIDKGSIFFDGDAVHEMGPRIPLEYRRAVQAVFQDPGSSLNPRKLVGEILAEPLRRHGKARGAKAAQKRVKELLDQVELASYLAGRYSRELSGGQQQRVAIARALAVEPRFIVCDEILSALDVSTQGSIVNLLQGLQRELGLTYLFIAHDLAIVHHISHRIGVMRTGELLEVDEASRVYRHPRHPYTQALIAAEPVADPRAQRERRSRSSAALAARTASSAVEKLR